MYNETLTKVRVQRTIQQIYILVTKNGTTLNQVSLEISFTQIGIQDYVIIMTIKDLILSQIH